MKYTFISFFFKAKTKQNCHSALSQTNTYYKHLSPENQFIFRIRTLLFLRSIGFDSKLGFEITPKMEFIISGAFIQLTFGLGLNSLSTFNTIFITPKSYAYKNNPLWFNGDVNPLSKRINLSWAAAEKGFLIPDDALNLCIHEFSHCLVFENAKKLYGAKFFKKRDFELWKTHAKTKIIKIKAKENKVLRDYAATNLMECFSVSIETFFERPEHFKIHEPKLYYSLTQLLKQDPMQKRYPTKNNLRRNTGNF